MTNGAARLILFRFLLSSGPASPKRHAACVLGSVGPSQSNRPLRPQWRPPTVGLNPKKNKYAAPPDHPFHSMRQHRLFRIAVVYLFFALLAHGHAILLTATPSNGQVVRGPDIEVNFRFNSRVNAKGPESYWCRQAALHGR
jgi:hypothetical protein